MDVFDYFEDHFYSSAALLYGVWYIWRAAFKVDLLHILDVFYNLIG